MYHMLLNFILFHTLKVYNILFHFIVFVSFYFVLCCFERLKKKKFLALTFETTLEKSQSKNELLHF